MKGEDCVRRKIEVNGENYYVIIGKDFLHITIPNENDPDVSREREAMEALTQVVNEVMEENNERSQV